MVVTEKVEFDSGGAAISNLKARVVRTVHVSIHLSVTLNLCRSH